MAEETREADPEGGSRQGHGGGGKNHGMPLGEATPEVRKKWKADLEESGKYTPGASLKDLIAQRDGTGAVVEEN